MAIDYRFNDFVLDRTAGELLHRGLRVPLEPKALDVLVHLVRNRDRTVQIEELLTTYWSDTAVERGSVHRVISLLRRRLGDGCANENPIETVARKGYRFALEVQEDETFASLGARSTYVGRREVLSALDDRLESAFRGRTELVLLHGPAGIGKSTTLARLVERAERAGATVFEGRCIEGPSAAPYRPWSRILRACLDARGPTALGRGLGYGAEDVALAIPEVGAALGFDVPAQIDIDQGAPFRVRDSIAEWIRDCSKTSPLVLILDDLHRADLDSIQLLAFLLQELTTERVLLATAYREGPDADRIHRELDRIVTLRPTAPIQLAEFSREEVEAFVRDRTEASFRDEEISGLVDQTGGNPLFLEHVLLSSGETDFSRTADPRHIGLRGALRRLLDDASARCREMLSFACVFGREFEAATVAEGLEWPIEQVETVIAEACDLRILDRGHQDLDVRFVHGLIPEVLYAEIPVPELGELHRRAIEGILATRKGPRDSLNELAHHARNSASLIGNDIAFRYTIDAARDAAKRLGYDDAVSLYEYALSLPAVAKGAGVSAAERAGCLIELGDTLVVRGNGAEARRYFDEACEIAREIDDPVLFAKAALGPTNLEEYDPIDDEHIAILNEAIERLGDRDPAVRVQLLTGVARTGYLSNRERTLKASEEGLEIARSLDDPTQLCDSLLARADALGWTHDREQCLALLTEADELTRRRPVPPMVKGLVLRSVAYEALVRGDRGGYERQIRELEVITRAHRLSFFDWRVSAMKTTLALTDGRFDEARQMLDRQLEQGQRANPRLSISISGVQAAVVGLATGDPAVVASSMKSYLDVSEGLISWCSPLALALAGSGQFEQAAIEAEPLVRANFEPRHRDYLPMVLACFAEAAQMMGDRKLADRVGDELAELPDRYVVLGLCLATYGAVDRYRGLCAETLGDLDAAIDYYAKGLVIEAEMGAEPMLASGLYDHGRALRMRGGADDLPLAEQQLQRALELAERLGMQRLADRIQS